jgi:hypothetical protein
MLEDLTTWTVIATANPEGKWDEVIGAKLTIRVAHHLLAEGHILMAQRRGPWSPNGEARMELVVKRSGR